MIRDSFFKVTGMNCSACSARVERAVAPLPGVQQVQVSLLAGSMKVTYDDAALSGESIMAAAAAAGYAAAPAKGGEPAVQQKDAPLRRRFLLSVLFLLPVVLIHHAGHGNGAALLQLALTLPILWLNRAFFTSGIRSLLHGAANMDTLVSLGATAAMVDGAANFFLHHRGEFYFESAAMILTLITLGKWLEARATGRTGAALQKLLDLLPQTAVVLRDGQLATVPAEAVQAGETVLVRPGDRVPVDGKVTEGFSSLDESALTGESMPVEKSPGSCVYAGSINGNNTLHIRASKPRAESAMAGIIHLVGEAAASKAPISRLADRLAGIFVPLVTALACLTTALWLLAGYPSAFAISCGIAVLVISCPCALGLATPVAIMAGTGKGAENGILFRNGEALEKTHQLDYAILDKTGTLTEGKPQVTDICPAAGYSPDDLMQLAVALESGGNHPLAQAILTAARQQCISAAPPASRLSYLPGRGIKADIGGEPCAAGNALLMQECGVEADTDKADRLAEAGKTPLFFARGGRFIGLIAVADPIKGTSRAAIAAMQQLGLRVMMMTGDHARTAQAVARQAGIGEWRAEAMPQDKDAMVRELQGKGCHVAMVGDGINDAPALTRADVGIAIGAGTDIALESADVILVRNDLQDVVGAIRLSKATMRNIRENLFWAFLYNILAIPLAAGVFYPLTGWLLHPAVAAAAMGLSSFCVVSNALRLRRFTFTPPPPSMDTITIPVEGMMCPHCEAHVTKALLSIPGVAGCKADHKAKRVTVSLSQPVPAEKLHEAIRQAGYTVSQ